MRYKYQMQKRRAEFLKERDQKRLRSLHGEKLVAAISRATGKPLSLDDFRSDSKLPPIDWPTDIRKASGLVSAYISKSSADELLKCVRDKLSALNGQIGFHDKPYLGFAKVHEIDPLSLIAVSEATEDSAVFYSAIPKGILMVDFYKSQPSEPFSIVAQGIKLVQKLSFCFPVQCKGEADD
ncbi:hypothetical protein ABE488_17660 [Luteimonas sp. TWI662]|uniref:hypothetical protein n=1 Tax=Luteimonas sp. TWI662 TaxID=3136789 RepID=UPI00320AFEC0